MKYTYEMWPNLCYNFIVFIFRDLVKIFHHIYFQGFSEDQEASARSSFPSGHASQAAFAAIFLMLFVQVIFTAFSPAS